MDEQADKEQQKHPGGRPRILQSLETAESLIELYFKQEPEKPTMAGLALHLGFADRKSLMDYIDRDDEFSLPIKRAVGQIEAEHETRLYGSQCTGSIFWLKNRGWKDSHDFTSDGKQIKSQTVDFSALCEAAREAKAAKNVETS